MTSYTETYAPSKVGGYDEPQIVSIISLLAGPLQWEQLCDYFGTPLDIRERIILDLAQRQRNSKPLTTSARSSISSICSFVSSNSSRSPESRLSNYSTAEDIQGAEEWHGRSHHDRPGHLPSPQPSGKSPHCSHEAPSPAFLTRPGKAATDNKRHACVRCVTLCANTTTLEKHRKRQCEKTEFFVCFLCSQEFFRSDHLKTHFWRKHAGECSLCCSWPNLCADHLKKLEAEAASRPLPAKRAWGCPICESWFNKRDEWHKHETLHYEDAEWPNSKEEKLRFKQWSRITLITSLLHRSKHLAPFVGRYVWAGCKWPEDGELYDNLVYALERYVVPEPVGRSSQSFKLLNARELVDYVWCVGHAQTTPQALARATPQQHNPAVLQSNAPELLLSQLPITPSGRRNSHGSHVKLDHATPTRSNAPRLAMQQTSSPQQAVQHTNVERWPRRVSSRSDLSNAYHCGPTSQPMPPSRPPPLPTMSLEAGPQMDFWLPIQPTGEIYHADYDPITAINSTSKPAISQITHETHDPNIPQYSGTHVRQRSDTSMTSIPTDNPSNLYTASDFHQEPIPYFDSSDVISTNQQQRGGGRQRRPDPQADPSDFSSFFDWSE